MMFKAVTYKTLGIAALVFFLLPQTVLADDTSVDSQCQGQSITCVNGKCTTSGGGGTTKVCHNGVCTVTDCGNVDYTSPDGHTHIQVNNNSGDNSINGSPEPTASTSNVSPSPSDTPMPSLTPDPTITQMRKDIDERVKKETDALKAHMKTQDDAITAFIDSQMEALQKLLESMFK